MTPETENADYALLDLFRGELAEHAGAIDSALNQSSSPDWEALRQHAHAIWGGARIAELEPVADLIQALEHCFVQAQEHPPGEAMFEAMLRGITWLDALSGEESARVRARVEQATEELLHIGKLLGECGANGEGAEEAAPASPAAEVPPTPSAAAPTKPPPPAAPKKAVENAVPNLDPGLLELFLAETETHTEILNSGLLALENDPTAMDTLEALMRAAHSIKGGARVVGLDLGVQLAHAMEDCFVAAQKGEVVLGSAHIDTLLAGVDVVTRMAAMASQNPAELPSLGAEIDALVARLQGKAPMVPPLVGAEPETAAEPEPPAEPETTALVHQPATPAEPGTDLVMEEEIQPIRVDPKATPDHAPQDRVVRVSASKIERLMALAGEVAVSARWLPPFSESLLTLKRAHLEIGQILDKLQDDMNQKLDLDAQQHKELLKAREKNKECTTYLSDRLNQLDVFTSTFANHSDRLYREMIGVRMRPFADGIKGIPRMVRDLARQLEKKVRFEIAGKNTEVDQDIQEKLDAPLNHLLRNALDHGLESPAERIAAGKPESGKLRLEAGHRSGMLMITVSDDGRGIDLRQLREKVVRKGLATVDIARDLSESELLDFLFLPGFSTAHQVTEISGRGVGLDVVHNMVHEVGGIVRAETQAGQGMTFHLELPLTLSVIRTFLVTIGGEPYAFPLARIDRCLQLHPEDIQILEDRQFFRFNNTNIGLVNIHDVLELGVHPPRDRALSVVVISDRFNTYGLVVDAFLGEYDLVVRPLDSRLGKVPDISAVAVMLDGNPVLIFDVEDLVHSIDKMLSAKRLRKISSEVLVEEEPEATQKRILVVDDSLTVREMERKLLEHQGYLVHVAVDGMDGWNAVRTESYDLVVTDVDMPRMNGIELVRKIKQNEDLRQLPVVIVSYKDTEAHRMQGLEAGADYYLTKSSFEDDTFVNAVGDLIGEAVEP